MPSRKTRPIHECVRHFLMLSRKVIQGLADLARLCVRLYLHFRPKQLTERKGAEFEGLRPIAVPVVAAFLIHTGRPVPVQAGQTAEPHQHPMPLHVGRKGSQVRRRQMPPGFFRPGQLAFLIPHIKGGLCYCPDFLP